MMDLKKASDILYELIEHANGNGMFKRLADLDTVREAYNVVVTELNNIKPLPDEKST